MNDNGQYLIRRGHAADLPDLLFLLKQLFAVEKDFSFQRKRQLQGLRLMLADTRSIVLVAEQENRVIGMCTGQLLISTAEGGPAVLVEDLVIFPDRQGKGVGRLLMRAMSSWAETNGATRMQLLSDRNNGSALKFYQKTGWQLTELICLRKIFNEG